MSVKIEILDYKYLQSNLLTWSNNSVSNWNTGTGITTSINAVGSEGVVIKSTAGVSGYYDGFDCFDLTLQNNHSYTLTYTCSFLDDAGLTTSKVYVRGAGGGTTSYRPFGNQPITVGTHSYTFTMDTSQNNGSGSMDVKFQLTDGGSAEKQVKIKDVKLVNNTLLSDIDWDNSVVGELDVTDHSDFPLAMTFQISDIKDLTSTSGDYSKTFKIPATKNNNKLLKNPYIPNIDTEVNITENKKCRILVNNLFSIVGLIKITGVSGYGETPSHYDCVFFGNNLSWADDLSNLYMHELNWGTNSEGLEYNKTKIMDTWQDEDCDSSTSPIVYPITSYGEYNPDGEPKTIQLLDTHYDWFTSVGGTTSSSTLGYYGCNNAGNDYGTPKPSADWRPAVFVKDTLEKIFNKVGYKISSTFMETDMFKKLVWLLPNFKYNNPEYIYDNYSVESNFTNTLTLDTTVYSGGVSSVITDAGFFESFYGGSVSFNDGDASFTGDPTISGTDGTKLVPLDATRLNVSLDNGSYVDTIKDYVTMGEYGYYDIKLNGIESRVAIIWANTSGGNSLKGVDEVEICLNIDVQTVGQTSWKTLERSSIVVNNLGQISNANLPYTNANNSIRTVSFEALPSIAINSKWLNKGDRVRITTGFRFNTMISQSNINSQNFTVNIFNRVSGSTAFNITLNSEAVDYGQTYDLKDVINKDYKSLDFVKGIAHAFNLKMTTDETTKTVNIEPFNSFYKDYAEAIDWTYKLDRSKQIDDKWIKSDLKRDIVFKYTTDSKDKKVERRGEDWFDGIKDEYPYQETLPKTFEKGESKYENPFFAGTFNSKDQDTTGGQLDTAFSACLWEGITDPTYLYRPDKGYEFLPRLLYWNKYSPPTVAAGFDIKLAKVQTWANTFGLLLADAANTSVTSNIYPQATSINRDDSSSPILSYGNVNVRDYDDATGVYTSYAAGKGLFSTYYKNMFEMLKAKPRLRTVYVDLKVKDIITLDFTKLIYIDGVYWRINKVVDYQPNKNQSTKVELIEWINLGVFAATAPSFGGNNNIGGLGNEGGTEDSNLGL